MFNFYALCYIPLFNTALLNYVICIIYLNAIKGKSEYTFANYKINNSDFSTIRARVRPFL